MAKAVASAFETVGWKVAAPGKDELDVTCKEAIRTFFESRPVDLLVCAAGLALDAPLIRYASEAWETVMTVNFQGAADCAAAVLPGMVGRRTGHIVFVSSYSALHPPVGQVAYSTAKAALLGLTFAMAREHGSNGIRVNAILPGFLDTRMTEQVSPARKEEVLSAHVLDHFNTPEAVGRFVRFLEENLPFTSGQIFQLDSRIS